MKFKFNYLENKLWRIKDDYLYEISEESRHIEYRLFGMKISFQLGENQYLVLNSNDEFDLKMTVYYVKPGKNGELAYYEKQITRNCLQIETIIEFTEESMVSKNDKDHWIPKQF